MNTGHTDNQLAEIVKRMADQDRTLPLRDAVPLIRSLEKPIKEPIPRRAGSPGPCWWARGKQW